MSSKLIILVGLPRSGKSYYSRTLNAPVVNPDSIRLAVHGQRYIQQAEDLVWVIAKIMVKSLFLSGHETVVLDATNTTKKRREMWKDKEYDIEFHVIETGKEICIARATAEGDNEIIEVINRMSTQFEPVTDDEGTVIKVNQKLS
jgi:predicted kinase